MPYTRIYLSFLAEQLHVEMDEVMALLSDLILDGALNAKIDEIAGILISESTSKATRYSFAFTYLAINGCSFRSEFVQTFLQKQLHSLKFLESMQALNDIIQIKDKKENTGKSCLFKQSAKSRIYSSIR